MCCSALITINDNNSCYFILNFFPGDLEHMKLLHGWPTCLRLGSTRKFLDNSRSTSR